MIFGRNCGQIAEMPVNNSGFVTPFLKHVAEKAKFAKTKGTSLVIMVFAPVTPDQDICVDFGSPSEGRIYLTVETICKTINTAVGDVRLPVTLVTPSPLTGGWMCRPALLGQNACSSSDNMMRVIAKSCGGAFANYFMRFFTQRDTPLLTDAQRQKTVYDNLMPVGPTELQTILLHRLQRLIHESLEQRISVLAREHGLILHRDATKDPSSFTDSWTSYTPRHGRTLEYWAGKWSIIPPIVEADQFEFLGNAFGGSKESQAFHLKYLCTIELETCPGDWKRNVNGITHGLLTSFLQTPKPQENILKRVFDAVEFRASSMILAQSLARALDLPIPDGLKCRYWHDKIDGVDDKYYSRLQAAFGEAHNLFDQAAVFPSEKPHEYKMVRFQRAARWLSAAIASKFSGNDSRKDIEIFVRKDVDQFVTKIRDTQRILLLEDQAVRGAGLMWIAALGLNEGGSHDTAVPSTVMGTSAVDASTNNVGPSLSNNLDGLAAPRPANHGRVAISPVIRNLTTPDKNTEYGSSEDVKGMTLVTKRVTPQFGEIKDAGQHGLGPSDTNLARDEMFRRIAAMHNIKTARPDTEQAVMGADGQCIPVTNGSGPWEEAANPITTFNADHTRGQARPVATEGLLGERRKVVDHAEKQATPAAWDATCDVGEDQRSANQSAGSSATAGRSSSEPADILSASLARLLTGNLEVDVANITQVLFKAVELVVKERTGEVFPGSVSAPIIPVGDATATEHSLECVSATGGGARTSDVPVDDDTAPIGLRNVLETTTGHSRVNSFDTRMESMTMSDSTPPRTPGTGGMAGELLPNEKENEGLTTTKTETSISNGLADSSGAPRGCSLASGDDFFTRGRIPWFGRN